MKPITPILLLFFSITAVAQTVTLEAIKSYPFLTELTLVGARLQRSTIYFTF